MSTAESSKEYLFRSEKNSLTPRGVLRLHLNSICSFTALSYFKRKQQGKVNLGQGVGLSISFQFSQGQTYPRICLNYCCSGPLT